MYTMKINSLKGIRYLLTLLFVGWINRVGDCIFIRWLSDDEGGLGESSEDVEERVEKSSRQLRAVRRLVKIFL
jgi:hypothetical protein